MLATILGEESTPQGQSGVANVIRNRAVDGGYGGDTPSAVVQSPKQFEPWSTPEGRARMASALQNPTQVASADNAIKMAYGEGGKAPEDPTEGKTMFYAPQAQAALGRPLPHGRKARASCSATRSSMTTTRLRHRMRSPHRGSRRPREARRFAVSSKARR